jgi:N-acetylglucosamine-6-sulfatase
VKTKGWAATVVLVASLCSCGGGKVVSASHSPAASPTVAHRGERRISEASTPKLNVVILMSDDQRWDMVTPTFTPRIWNRLIDHPASSRFPAATSVAFTNSFVPNPQCCPSRTSTLTGRYSHTTGVWSNGGEYGGFGAFNDKHTIAVDFNQAGYRTAMIGKYLNGYVAGRDSYVPPGWDRWFAASTAAYYDYGITTNHKLLNFGTDPQDYITRVLSKHARTFVTNAQKAHDPFFLYYAFTAPHSKSIPDPRDIGRFDSADTGLPHTNSNMLNSAYGVDRAVGQLLKVLPPNTLVIYMSDNGYLWGESKGDRGPLHGKLWPYNESIRVPIVLTSLDGSRVPNVGVNDLVLNVDLRPTLTHAAGISPLTHVEGRNWFAATYTPRSAFPLEHLGTRIPTYCGVRESNLMYVRFIDRTEEMYDESGDHPAELANLVGNPDYQTDYDRLKTEAQTLCDPAPPGYSWSS